jgi:putative hydrolase of the HAD superfamily
MIKTLIFDFGDVFLTLNKAATDKHLKRFAITNLDHDLLELNRSYEKGMISSEAFVNHYTERFPVLTEHSFIEAWNSILVEFPVHRLEFLKKIRATEKFKMILLSNTNELHIEWVKKNINLYEEFKSNFDQFYLSHEIHYRKPDQDIFKFVLDENELDPNETLFIDDTQEHIQSAQLLGIHTWHLKAGAEDITELFTKKSDIF